MSLKKSQFYRNAQRYREMVDWLFGYTTTLFPNVAVTWHLMWWLHRKEVSVGKCAERLHSFHVSSGYFRLITVTVSSHAHFLFTQTSDISAVGRQLDGRGQLKQKGGGNTVIDISTVVYSRAWLWHWQCKSPVAESAPVKHVIRGLTPGGGLHVLHNVSKKWEALDKHK
jgi:hypothetical protein